MRLLFRPLAATNTHLFRWDAQHLANAHTKLLGLSVDPVEDHHRWLNDVESYAGTKVGYPIIGDHDLKVAKLYDMLPQDAGDTAQGRTAATNATVRTVYFIGPDKQVKAMLVYPMSTGRNWAEVLRLLDSIQLTARHKVATPVNWKQGEDCIIVPSVSDEEARTQFPGGWTSDLPYLRRVPQPGREEEQSQSQPEQQPA